MCLFVVVELLHSMHTYVHHTQQSKKRGNFGLSQVENRWDYMCIKGTKGLAAVNQCGRSCVVTNNNDTQVAAIALGP